MREGFPEGGRGGPEGGAGGAERARRAPPGKRKRGLLGAALGGAGPDPMGAELELFWRRGKLASSCAVITFINSYSFMIVDFYWGLFFAIVETVF